jgi:hypothetical protein
MTGRINENDPRPEDSIKSGQNAHELIQSIINTTSGGYPNFTKAENDSNNGDNLLTIA